jgi:hypothetical protein
MINLIEEALRGQGIVAEANRKARIKAKVENQTKRLAKVNKTQGYTTIPQPVWEETDAEYMKRIGDMNLRVAIAPLAKVVAQHEAEKEGV